MPNLLQHRRLVRAPDDATACINGESSNGLRRPAPRIIAGGASPLPEPTRTIENSERRYPSSAAARGNLLEGIGIERPCRRRGRDAAQGRPPQAVPCSPRLSRAQATRSSRGRPAIGVLFFRCVMSRKSTLPDDFLDHKPPHGLTFASLPIDRQGRAARPARCRSAHPIDLARSREAIACTELCETHSHHSSNQRADSGWKPFRSSVLGASSQHPDIEDGVVHS